MKIKINICMLLGFRYDPKMRIHPEIGIASHISNFGHNVTWVLSSEKLEKIYETSVDHVRILVVPCKYGKNLAKFFSFVSYALRRIIFVFKTFKKSNYNLIFVSNSLLDGIMALCIRLIFTVPMVIEIHNPFEQKWICYGDIKTKYFWYILSSIDSALWRYILYNADLILPVGRFMKKYLIDIGLKESKMMNLPQGVKLDRFLAANENPIKWKYGLSNYKIIIYVGIMSKLRNLEVLIYAFSIVKEKAADVKLLMVGDGDDRSNLEKLAIKLRIEKDVIFTGDVYDYEIPNYIAAADIGVSPIPPLEIYKVSCPIKMLEYMAMGKPVVANEEIPEQKEVMQNIEAGILVKFESSSLADGIIRLLENPTEAEEMGKKGYEWVRINRSFETLAKKLEKRYFKLIMEKRI